MPAHKELLSNILYWLNTSEEEVIAINVQLSHQLPIILLPFYKKEYVQECDKITFDIKMHVERKYVAEFIRKNCFHCQLTHLEKYLQIANSGYEHSFVLLNTPEYHCCEKVCFLDLLQNK